jgi:DNA polymerase-3 subunit delta
MPRVTFSRLASSLKSGPAAPAYYIHGAEGILKDEALALILNRALDPGTRDFNLDVLSAQQIDPAELAAACATLPMMAERRVVVLRDVEAWKRKSKAKQPAVQYLEHPMLDTVLVMVQGNDDDPDDELASRSTAIECIAPVGDQLESWLDERLVMHSVQVVPEAREHLIRATGGDLGLLAAEVQKLGGLQVTGPIDANTVGDLVGVRFGETVDDWRDAVLRDETSRALALLPKLLETTGISGVKLVTQLGTSLVVMRWARATAERRKIRDAALARVVKSDLLFKVRPGVGSYDPFVRVVGEVVGRWSQPRLTTAIAAVLQADMALKQTTISGEGGIVTDLILTLATSRARRAA